MTPAAAAPFSVPAVLPLRRLSVDEYLRLIESGILADAERLELLDGYMVLKPSGSPPHDVALSLTEAAIRALLPPGWFRRGRSSVTTADSVPEPDIAVVRGQPRDYAARHPRPLDVVVVGEAADTTLLVDRHIKGPIYARAAIPVYWIVNVTDRCVEVYTDPTGPAAVSSYRQRADLAESDNVPLVLRGTEVGRIAVRDLLP
jgi:Uma2 family endonuclease